MLAVWRESHRLLYEKDGYRLLRCDDCDLAFIGNPPTEEELKEIYSFGSNYHKRFATSEAARRRHLQRARKNYSYLTRAGVEAKGRLLDVGCSAGFFLKVAADAGWNVQGVEISADTAALAGELYGVSVHAGTLATYPSDGELFDCVTLWDVIEHVLDPQDVVQQVASQLRDGGLFVLTTPNIDGLYPRLSYPLTAPAGCWRHPEPPKHLVQFSESTVTRFLEANSFEVLHVVHEKIPVFYSLGNPLGLVKRPWRVLEYLISVPLILLGPSLNAGDEICVIARKR